jgi:hypothetical protein
MQKQKKTTHDLIEMAMKEVQKYPECKDISSVNINRPLGRNWGVVVTRNLGAINPASQTRLEEIVNRLRAEFDLR